MLLCGQNLNQTASVRSISLERISIWIWYAVVLIHELRQDYGQAAPIFLAILHTHENFFGKTLTVLKTQCDAWLIQERQYSASMQYMSVCIIGNYESLAELENKLPFYRR